MSTASNIIFSKVQSSERDEIEDVIESKYVNDYGTIVAMHGQTSCDVQHAVMQSASNGGYLKPTVTKNVEILWPSSALISISWDLAVGDKVWLVGFKHYITLAKDTFPKYQRVYNSYNQETLKAVPYGLFNDEAGIKIKATGGNISIDMGTAGTVAIKNAVTSLKTILDTLMNYMTALAATPAVPGSPVWPPGAADFPALQAQIDELIGE